MAEPEITIEGYFRISDTDDYQNPRYRSGKSENGKEWQMVSFSISVTVTTFDRKLIAQIKQLASKQKLSITGLPEVSYKEGKQYFCIKPTKIVGAYIADTKQSQPIPTPGTADEDLEDTFL